MFNSKALTEPRRLTSRLFETFRVDYCHMSNASLLLHSIASYSCEHYQ